MRTALDRAGRTRKSGWIGGSGIWCSVLCYVGVKMGQDEGLMNFELRRVAIWVGGAALVLGGLYYFFVHRHLQKKL